jgi:hypothetical protein
MNCIDRGRNTSAFYQCLENGDSFSDSEFSEERCCACKAPGGFEPPRKALQAFPFPLGYGATSQSIKSAPGVLILI